MFGFRSGVNNITVRYNYIHDVESYGIQAFNGYASEVLRDWTITHNKIEKFGQCGINLYNAGDSIISENQISNPNPGSSNAILLRAHAVSSVTRRYV